MGSVKMRKLDKEKRCCFPCHIKFYEREYLDPIYSAAGHSQNSMLREKKNRYLQTQLYPVHAQDMHMAVCQNESKM